MKLLVIGSGGREHALVWKLAQSHHVARMWCAPGNAGIGMERLAKTGETVRCIPVGAEDLSALLLFAEEQKPDLTVVGPDNPLALGIVDLFQSRGLRIWGVNRSAARFEASKAFSQGFMEKYGIPTPVSGVFGDADQARAFGASLGGRCAVKADGLALGKGVLICRTEEEAGQAIDRIMVERAFGDAGGQVVIQELLEGREVSLHALCDGTTARLFPTAQDHKRALDGDQGLNTGGMGTYSPAPFLSEAQMAEVESTVVQRWLSGCHEEGIDFRGLLYPGLMLTSAGPKVLEFNARFGDPETQVYLTRLESDLVELLSASVDGTLAKQEMKWTPQASVCVVMVSEGYPEAYTKGKPILGLEEAERPAGTKVFHSGTRWEGETLVTNGGRVLGVTAVGSDLIRAREAAYAGVGRIRFDGAQFRRDIAAQAIQ